MTLNVSANIRATLYVITAVGTPLVAYLAVIGVISANEVALWSAEVTAVSALAAFNVTSDKQ